MSDLISGLTNSEWNDIRAGRPLNAIKAVKDRLGTNLTEAKKIVDNARAIHPLTPPSTSRPITTVLESMLSNLDSMEYHVNANDSAQVNRMRLGLQENIREILKTIRGYV